MRAGISVSAFLVFHCTPPLAEKQVVQFRAKRECIFQRQLVADREEQSDGGGRYNKAAAAIAVAQLACGSILVRQFLVIPVVGGVVP